MDPGRRRGARPAPLVGPVLALVTVAALVATAAPPAVGASRAPATSSFHPDSGFGGYRLFATVTSVAADWTVPAISPSSPAGHASTWIGAQGPGNDFIQLGVTEDRTIEGWPVTLYRAFWSDSRESFLPQYLAPVTAGSVVSASMTQRGRGWTLRFVDRANNVALTRVVPYDRGVAFTSAEWLQENPVPVGGSAVDLPYPIMGAPVFSLLRLNGARPRLALAQAQVLMPSNRSPLVPTRVRDGSFTLVRPTSWQRLYLAQAQRFDRAAAAFDYRLAGWTTLTLAQRRRAVELNLRALLANNRTLSRTRWPAATRARVLRMVKNFDRQEVALSAWLRTPMRLRSAAYGRFVASASHGVSLADATRASLGLPPTTP